MINAAIYAGQTTVVTKNGTEVVEIKRKKRVGKGEKTWEEYKAFLESIKGDMADYPEDENRKRLRQTIDERI